jgi:hypothetical protein
MNNRYEDECNDASIDNYVGILAIVMVLAHLWYRCCYFFCGCNAGKSIFCIIDDSFLDIYTGTANWVMMVKEQFCILMNNKYEDECNGVSIDNDVGILAKVMVLVHLCYGCCYFFCGYNGGNGQYIWFEVKLAIKLSGTLYHV